MGGCLRSAGSRVALLAEGVDRNTDVDAIEELVKEVALLAEGVDRNVLHFGFMNLVKSRPPRGGRG